MYSAAWKRSGRRRATLVVASVGFVVLGSPLVACGPSPAARTPETDGSRTAVPTPSESASPVSAGAEPEARPDDLLPLGAPAEASGHTQAASNETRTTSVIQKIIRDHRQSFRDCYDDFLVGHPAIAADLTLGFTIGRKGDVKSASIDEAVSTSNDPELAQCLVQAMRALTFPPSSRGFESTVSYPFNFNP